MELKQAGMIDLQSCQKADGFAQLCRFAESLDVGISDQYAYRARDGTVGLDVLVRQADWANVQQKGRIVKTSLEFILCYLDEGFIPFSVFNNAAIDLSKKYHTKFGQSIDEKTAMAAILMVAVGYEQEKLCILRKMAERHNRESKQCENSAPVRRVTSAQSYAKYHVDMVETLKGNLQQAYQMEWRPDYFEMLQYQKESAGLTAQQRERLDINRAQLNRFLAEYQNKPVSFLTAHKQTNGGTRILMCQTYTRVEPTQPAAAYQH